jgi:hypothetical protein
VADTDTVISVDTNAFAKGGGEDNLPLLHVLLWAFVLWWSVSQVLAFLVGVCVLVGVDGDFRDAPICAAAIIDTMLVNGADDGDEDKDGILSVSVAD